MLSVFDIVKFILTKKKPLSNMNLQKLVYYCQAWSLVWDGKPLFKERIEAWANGPVVSELYNLCRGEYFISDIPKGDSNNIISKQRETILAVLKYYGDKSPQWLSDLTHSEDPWRKAREGIPEGVRSNKEITLASMEEYYSSLQEKK
ncbi:hypothetical protein A3E89_01950 [Candidatus Campbellbacteria bacterium RIFCSPHIGHO2_12_FULL_35_10]|uniref:Antitoxin SocA-like Panacea domain-containing protein n=1 Tax=Candidatus Campbellbacteria bacterium RIFCSPHIGHO2_12_FULL_35_10 TaxID=1797578 RepID=A0A1F5EQF6_9BACT|nr:MAG: hypothetical protein A3E89_01950 [Candidatus Campbellbacteria bacterium RIFCSPHIGHO2_12_FULL_35_10]